MLLCKFTARAAANQSARASVSLSHYWSLDSAARERLLVSCRREQVSRSTGGTWRHTGGYQQRVWRKRSWEKTQCGWKCGKRSGFGEEFSQHEARRQSYHTGADVIWWFDRRKIPDAEAELITRSFFTLTAISQTVLVPHNNRWEIVGNMNILNLR